MMEKIQTCTELLLELGSVTLTDSVDKRVWFNGKSGLTVKGMYKELVEKKISILE